MIKPVIDFAQELAKTRTFDKVLEVGSRDVNGSVKGIFNWGEYIGLDIIDDQKSVDVIDDAMNIPNHWTDETFDLVICTETLEHVKNPTRMVELMRNVLKKGGWMFITTPGIGHPEHDWPSDYYRFFENTYKDVFFEGFEEVVTRTLIWDSPGLEAPNSKYPHAILGYGRKP